MPGGKKKALLVADVDRIQDYVFESSRLPEIRGASRWLDDLNHQAARRVEMTSDEVIIEGGGRLVALVPEELAPVLCKEIESLYPSKTGAVTITADWRPVSPDMLARGYPESANVPFGSLMTWANTWLRRRKDQRDYVSWIEALPFEERCHSCQIRPADPSSLSHML